MRFAFFPLHLSKVLRLPRKSEARSYEVLHLSRKIIFWKLKIWCSKMQPLSGNQRPDLLASLLNMSLALRLPRKIYLDRSSSNVPHLPSFLEMLQNPHVLPTFHKVHNPLRLPRERHLHLQKWFEHVVLWTFWLRNVLCATTACTFSTSQLPKVVRTCCVLYILTWKCASRIFAPQRRARFRHRNFEKCSEREVFLPFSEANYAPRATTACTFSTSQLPKVVRTCSVLSVLTSKRASRHNGVQFFISHLASWLRTHRFSEPTFRPSGATNHWENTVLRKIPTFSRTWIFFPLRLSLFWSSFFFSSLRWLFPSLLFICPYCRKFDF